MRLLICFIALTSAFGLQSIGHYTVEYGASLSAATAAITVHLPSAQAGVRIRFGTAAIYNSAACDWRTERDGTAPTATTVTPVKLNSYEPAAVFEAYRGSDVGSAARTHPTLEGLTGITTIDLTKEELLPGENLTFRTPSNCTCDYRVAVEVIQQTY